MTENIGSSNILGNIYDPKFQQLSPKQPSIDTNKSKPLLGPLQDSASFLPNILKICQPLPLCESQSKEPSLIVEPGVSAKTADAVKQIPGQNWAGKMASNGNREVAVMVPQGVDVTKPVEIIYYFHGNYGTIAGNLADPAAKDVNYPVGLKDPIKQMAKDKRNFILVMPQGPANEYDYTWMNGDYKEDLSKFQDESLKVIKDKLKINPTIESVTIKVHSAGGRVAMNAANDGKLKADRIDFYDASYGKWATSVYQNYISANPDSKFNIYYVPGRETQTDALSLKNKPGINIIPVNKSADFTGHMAVPSACLNK